jgi:Ca2+-binding RTX toxin-like protein
MTGAAKSAQVIGTDLLTGLDLYRVGPMTEIVTGTDPNGAKADAGITIYAPNLGKWFFETDFNRRNAPIPEGYIDAYSAILHEIAHTLGFTSTRDVVGNLPSVGMTTFDQRITQFAPGFLRYGLTLFERFNIGETSATTDDLAIQVYGNSPAMEIGNPNHLGTGRVSDAILTNPTVFISFVNIPPELFDDLSTDLMGGVPLPGERKTISRLDLAMLKDAGLPVDITADPSPQGLYTVNGTGFGDVIDVSSSNGTLLIRVNNSVTTFSPDDPVPAEITGIIVNGLNGNDVITISSNAPAVAINGGAGFDTIYGGTRGDSIYGGGSNDLIFGRGGGDLIRGGEGKDTLYGQGGTDRIFGDSGNDHLDGGLQTDRINGGSGADVVIGGTEDDFLFGDSGNDAVSGAGGKDRLDGGSGSDSFFGGSGPDVVDYSKSLAPVTATIDGSPDDGVAGEADNILDVENILGSSFDDVLVGSDGPNHIVGGAGNDTIDGISGNDTLEGNNGIDVLVGSGGHDNLLGGAGNDNLTGSGGRDRMLGEDGDDTFNASDLEIDTVEGGAGIDSVTGEGDDVLTDVESAVLDGGPDLPNPGPLPAGLTKRGAGLSSLFGDEDDDLI